MRVLLAAHGLREAALRIPQPGFLHHRLAPIQHSGLAPDLVLDGLAHVFERVDVLQFGLGAQLLGAVQSQGHVGVATKRSFFHVAVADAQGSHQGAQRAHVLGRFFRRANVGLAHDLDQRHARAVEVHETDARIVVDVLARVVLQVDAGQADAPWLASHAKLNRAAFAQRLFVLRDLKSLGQVRIEVVLARETTARPDVRTHGQTQAHRCVHHGPIEHRQCTR